MAAFALPDGRLRLVRNHEDRTKRSQATPRGAAALAYDRSAPGATCSIDVALGPRPRAIREFVSLSGTLANCAGGFGPWGSWLSCEETTERTTPLPESRGGWEKPHGYVFEVRAGADAQVAAVPITSLGRFAHEAVAVDPSSGTLYLTEENGYDSGFYRFVPERSGSLAAGRLEMLGVRSKPGYDTAVGQRAGAALVTHWFPDRPRRPT
jgi:secreted PhoX family phosphatase